MDYSKEYIEMCSKATEIQEFKKQHGFGDYVFRDGVVRVVNGYSLSEGCNEYRTIHNIDCDFIEQWFMENYQCVIWLPRQDQLQEIFGNPANNPYPVYGLINTLYRFGCWEGVKKGSIKSHKYSMEQLWLMLVMEKKYNKQWNPETKEWEKV